MRPGKFGTGTKMGPDRHCVHTGPLGTGTAKATYLVRSGSPCKRGSGTDLNRSRSRVNVKDLSHVG